VTAADWDGPSFQTLMNASAVARRFETSRRREALGFSHHAEVAPLPAAQADALLDAAEAEGWSTRVLRAEVGKVRNAGAIAAPVASAETVHRCWCWIGSTRAFYALRGKLAGRSFTGRPAMEKIDAKLLGMVSVTLLTRLTAHMERSGMLPRGWTATELRSAAVAADSNVTHGGDPSLQREFAQALRRIADLSLQPLGGESATSAGG
jgi:hypothetical protein